MLELCRRIKLNWVCTLKLQHAAHCEEYALVTVKSIVTLYTNYMSFQSVNLSTGEKDPTFSANRLADTNDNQLPE